MIGLPLLNGMPFVTAYRISVRGWVPNLLAIEASLWQHDTAAVDKKLDQSLHDGAAESSDALFYDVH